ncbi:hypothetical protein LCGC14_1907250 [marine sediment metagenome]|uniref:Uncharacterized protein n=1 Tax=marine sediment metagenome TaxID=412755 RepID=A0A0F9IST5_9ZZZZ
MNGFEILIPGAVLTIVAVVLGFVINQVLVAAGNRWSFTVSRRVKIGVVYVTSFVLTGFYSLSAGWVLPDVAVDPGLFISSLLAFALAVTKAAQPVYDLLGQGILTATPNS